MQTRQNDDYIQQQQRTAEVAGGSWRSRERLCDVGEAVHGGGVKPHGRRLPGTAAHDGPPPFFLRKCNFCVMQGVILPRRDEDEVE